MSDQVALAFALVAHCLCNLNSAINPVIYYLMSGKKNNRAYAKLSTAAAFSTMLLHIYLLTVA